MKRLITILLAAVLTAGAQTKPDAERSFKAAQNLEIVDGDLQGAIEQYGSIVAKFSRSERAVSAEALIRMAECHRKLGEAEAIGIYERVLREFADQRDSVAAAQVRLAALRGPQPAARTLTTRLVSDDQMITGKTSPDGRYISFTEWSKGGDVALKDLITGEVRLLTDRDKSSNPYGEGMTFSPDGREVAYLWLPFLEDDPENTFQLRVVRADGKGEPRILHRSRNYFFIRDWTPDKKSILVTRALDDESWQIAFISLEDGSVRPLKSFRIWAGIEASLSPDGRYVAYDAPVGDGTARDIHILAADGSSESAVMEHPANDHSTIWTPDGSRLLFVSDRTGTPALWSVEIEDGKAAGPAELLKADTGPMEPLGFTNEGTLYYMTQGRADHQSIYVAELDNAGKAIGPPALATEHYVNANWAATYSPDGKTLAYYSDRQQRVLAIRDLESGQERVVPTKLQIAREQFNGPGWMPDGKSLLVLSKENRRPGRFLSRVDLKTGEAEEAGVLTTGIGFKEAPDGASVYYRKWSPAPALARLDLASGRESIVLEKPTRDEYVTNVAVSPDGKLLGHLFVRGGERNEKSIAVMDLGSGEVRTLYSDPTIQRFNSLEWTPDQKHLIFVKEGERESLWRVNVESGKVESLGIETTGWIKAPQVHPDGRRIVFTTVEAGTDSVWALENFLPTRISQN